MKLSEADLIHSVVKDSQIKEFLSKEVEGRKNIFVLDIGSLFSPFYDEIKGAVKEYVRIDLRRDNKRSPDIVCLGESLPFKSGSFDLVLCTQVLEHVSDPWLVVEEARRVLRGRGVLILSTHGLWVEHGCPSDNWRFTSPGLRKLAENFSEARVLHQGNTFAGLAQLFSLAVKSRSGEFFGFRVPWKIFAKFKAIFCILPNLAGLLLMKKNSFLVTHNYLLVARK